MCPRCIIVVSELSPQSVTSALEKEYRSQIESFKTAERQAKEKMREMELSFLKIRQGLEAALEDEKSKVVQNNRCDVECGTQNKPFDASKRVGCLSENAKRNTA